MTTHKLQDLCYAYGVAEPVREMLFALQDRIDALEAQRQWVGLTDEDFLEACQIAERGNYLLALQRIQIKLKERNND